MIQKGHAAGYRQYSCRTSHKAGVQLLHRADATLLHCRARLGANEVEHAFDSLLTESAEAPEIWPPNASRMRSYGKGLDHVGATAEPAVNDHRHAIVHCRDDGSASIVDRPLSSPRPPWLDTMIPSIPFCAASSASSEVRMPLSTIFILVMSRMRFTVAQDKLLDSPLPVMPDRSMPS